MESAISFAGKPLSGADILIYKKTAGSVLLLAVFCNHTLRKMARKIKNCPGTDTSRGRSGSPDRSEAAALRGSRRPAVPAGRGRFQSA